MLTLSNLCMLSTIADINAGANPTKVDMNLIVSFVMISMIIIMFTSFIVVVIIDMYREHRDTKARELDEANRRALRDKYAHLTKGLSKWIDTEALLEVRYCEYSKDFHINYENCWDKLCIRGHIGLDGSIEGFHTIGGYKYGILNEEHEKIFNDTLQTLIGRIKDINDGILFESK